MRIETFQSYGCRTGAARETPEHCNNNDDNNDKATKMMMDAVQPWGVQNIFIINFPIRPKYSRCEVFVHHLFQKSLEYFE